LLYFWRIIKDKAVLAEKIYIIFCVAMGYTLRNVAGEKMLCYHPSSIKWKRQSLKIGAYLLLRRIENEKVKFIYQERPCTFLRTDSAEFVTTANSSHVSPWPMN